MKIKIRSVIFWIVFCLLFLLAAIIESLCDWFNLRFEISFEEILFTITSPLKGSDVSFLGEAVEYMISAVVSSLYILVLLLVIAVFLRNNLSEIKFRLGKGNISVKPYQIYKLISLLTVLVMLFNSINYGFTSLDLGTYISRRLDKTTIYEDYYVNPDDVAIDIVENPKNIIYVYLESMETTYASKDVGGQQEINYIPHLTELALENISFSHNAQLGGASLTVGTGWTMGALFATTAGVPFSFPIEGNSMNTFENFAPGIISLGDILDSFGYKQIFLCGSDGAFAGRQTYFEQHGNYEVHDYFYAVENGYIPEGYWIWWGYEDENLYNIAKKELLSLAEEDVPFNYTMLTVDTHHVDGYICNSCNSTYEHQLGNVLECADKQIYDFITWCQQQDFYENTVIVITGDHFRMDSSLVAGLERHLYNCIINSDKVPVGNMKDRLFTSLDIFPTTLSAMGFVIEGNRLGLGTDLFSDRQTLSEELGFENFDAELGKYSEYYVEVFE